MSGQNRLTCIACGGAASPPIIAKPKELALFGFGFTFVTQSGQTIPMGKAICTQCMRALICLIREVRDLPELPEDVPWAGELSESGKKGKDNDSSKQGEDPDLKIIQ